MPLKTVPQLRTKDLTEDEGSHRLNNSRTLQTAQRVHMRLACRSDVGGLGWSASADISSEALRRPVGSGSADVVRVSKRIIIVAKGAEFLRFEELSGVSCPDQASKPKLILAKLRCLQLNFLQLRALTPKLIIRCLAPCCWQGRTSSKHAGSISDSRPWATARAHDQGATVQRVL